MQGKTVFKFAPVAMWGVGSGTGDRSLMMLCVCSCFYVRLLSHCACAANILRLCWMFARDRAGLSIQRCYYYFCGFRLSWLLLVLHAG